MPRGANVISICPILMAMSFHLLVRSSGPSRAQDGSPLQRPEQEFAGRADVLWVSTVFFVRVIDMAVAL
jgi:hypothetical protein